MKLYCEHRIARRADDLWAVLHTPAFEARLAAAIGLSEYRELERREDAEAVYRRIQVMPRLPAGMEGLLRTLGVGEQVGYVEEQWRSRSERLVRWKMTPHVLADRMQIEGVIRIDPLPGASLRVLDGAVRVRIPGLGRGVEQAIVHGAIQAYGLSAVAAGADQAGAP